MIYRDGSQGVTPEVIASCVEEHRKSIGRLDKLDKYYRGEHDILTRVQKRANKPNNRVVCNFAKYITDTAVGYVFGNPVRYADGEGAEKLIELNKKAADDSHDAELAKDLSVFGVGCELAYRPDAGGGPKIALIDPRKCFVVYDGSRVDEPPLFGVYYYRKLNGGDGSPDIWSVTVYEGFGWRRFDTRDLSVIGEPAETGINPFGGIPLIEYWNNEEGMGDFEPVMSLIDAYNILASDRINDKEAFVQAILVLTGGASLGDESAEVVAAMNKLADLGLLMLPEGAKAEYLEKTLDEGQIELLRTAIASDIHKFAQVPDYTDERFSGNVSGVAIKYKLLSLETLAKTKERFFITGIRQRLRLLAGYAEKRGGGHIDIADVEITMNRTLPANELETAQTVNLLKGAVSKETLVGLLPFVKDAALEMGRLAAEEQEAANVTAAGFAAYR